MSKKKKTRNIVIFGVSIPISVVIILAVILLYPFSNTYYISFMYQEDSGIEQLRIISTKKAILSNILEDLFKESVVGDRIGTFYVINLESCDKYINNRQLNFTQYCKDFNEEKVEILDGTQNWYKVKSKIKSNTYYEFRLVIEYQVMGKDDFKRVKT